MCYGNDIMQSPTIDPTASPSKSPSSSPTKVGKYTGDCIAGGGTHYLVMQNES